MTRNQKRNICPARLIRKLLTNQENKQDISKSKTRNRIAMRKNRTEKGSPGLWKGSKPHS